MKFGIIGAMEPEVALLKEKLANREEQTFAGFTFYSGELNGHDVILVKSGIGKVASSVATTLLIEKYAPDCIVNTGSAGGLDPELEVGDVVISTELKHHDVDVTAFNYELGQVPNMPPAYIPHNTLVDAAERAAQRVGDVKIVKGLITTGDSFMCDPARIEEAKNNFPQMKAVEMEGAAIAQACHMLDTPFVVIRSLSDIAGKESPVSFEAYLEKASLYSSRLVEELLVEVSSL